MGREATVGDWEEVIGKRESEFKGLKGTLLRYGGVTFVLLIAIQLIKALMLGCGFTSSQVDVPFLAASGVAFLVYPMLASRLRRRTTRCGGGN